MFTSCFLETSDKSAVYMMKRRKQLSKAPLKPEQRLFLRVHVLPSLYHEMALSKYSKGLLKKSPSEVEGSGPTVVTSALCLRSTHLPTRAALDCQSYWSRFHS